MWQITNNTHRQSVEIEGGSWISIGNLDECELCVDKLPANTLVCQVFLDGLFLFRIVKGIVCVFYKKSGLNTHGIEFLFDCLDEKSISESFAPDYKKLSYLFRSPQYLKTLHHIHENLENESSTSSSKNSIERVLQLACDFLSKIFWKDKNVFDVNDRRDFKDLIWVIWAQIFDYGILSRPLSDDSISEVMVNQANAVYFEKGGKLIRSELSFSSDKEILTLIERMVHIAGRRIDESKPYCDARLKDGSRIHAIIPPIAINGPCLTVRKFPKHHITPQFLIESQSIPSFAMEFLKDQIVGKKNILISGGTGSGKTTLLNCLSSFIPDMERIITIEDSAELKLQQRHVVRLECRNENIENKGQIVIRDLLKNTLRMRPDRIIVGECRGAEALDMLQAMNTGHDGSMTTIHANSPLDALRRLETLVLFSELDLPSRAIREQIGSAIHYVVQQSRLVCGRRCVTQICRVVGLNTQTHEFLLEDIFHHQNRVYGK